MGRYIFLPIGLETLRPEVWHLFKELDPQTVCPKTTDFTSLDRIAAIFQGFLSFERLYLMR